MSTFDNQARFMIWSPPRSLSTAFTRSMSARGDTKVFWEPFLACFNYGADRKVHWADDKPELLNDKYSYGYVKDLLEEPHSDSGILFAKCMIEAIVGDFGVVPSGYQHSFLIRNPLKMFRSYEKLTTGSILPIDFTVTFKNIYHEMEKFYDHVISVLGQSAPPIIDADELMAQPETLLPKYCAAVGIPYTPKMLTWDSIENPALLNWECMDVGAVNSANFNNSVLLSKAFKSTGFGERGKKPEKIEFSDVSADVRMCAEYAMPVYDRLFQLRIKP